MKRSTIIAVFTVISLIAGFMTTSCNKFFETPDDSTINEDSIFLKMQNVRMLMSAMHTGNMNTCVLFYGGNNRFLSRLRANAPDAITDLGSGFSGSNTDNTPRFYNAQLTTAEGSCVSVGNSVYDYPRAEWIFRWTQMRYAHIIRNRIQEVPDASFEEKERIKGECTVFLAWMNFEMMRRFGGIPLVKKRLDDASEFAIPRSSFADTYDYVISLCNEAIANEYLPAKAVGTDFGRFNKAFAYALKAKAALTAASPLFNTGTPYLSLDSNNNLICWGNYDRERWNTAATYASEAISYCENNGYKIVDTGDPVESYKIATNDLPSNGNTELIYGWQSQIDANMAKVLNMRAAGGWHANMPTHNLVEMYRRTDGTFVNWESPITTAAGNPDEPYENLEPRFHATIGYNGYTGWKTYNKNSGSFTDFTLPIYSGTGGTYGIGAQGNQLYSYVLHKYLWGHENQIEMTPPAWWVIHLNMRLADLYMMRAEALNEYNQGPAGTCVSDLNKVLGRSGMSVPDDAKAGYEAMQRFIERERAIEFAWEDQRYMDLKRTLRAMDVLNTVAVDARCVRNADNTYTYTRTDVSERKFLEKYYLWPFPQSEINKYYGLIQNPGW